MFLTADQLLAHCVGDYLLQSDWMANKKRSDPVACLVHATVYTLCFIPFVWGRQSWASPLLVILATHQLIDHFGLARYAVWAKNFLAPPWILTTHGEGADALPICVSNESWKRCQATGYPPDRPPFLAVWLLIIADNVLHVVINGLALRLL